MKSRLILAALVAILLPGAACRAQVEVEARKIADAYKDTVVTVDLVVDIKMSYEGQSNKREQKHSTTATIIDPDGLAVASLTQVSPDSYRDPNDASANDTTFDIKDVKIRLADGTEIPADVVLRDRDLDLAFIRPKTKPAQPLPYVDLTKSSTPQLLDQVLVLSRLGQLANHALSARLDRIESVVTKPRTFYIIDGTLHQELGIPVFTLDSKCVGILVVRLNMSSASSGQERMYLSVLPCSTLATVAQQAKTAQPEVRVEPEPAPESQPKPVVKQPTKPATKAPAKPKKTP